MPDKKRKKKISSHEFVSVVDGKETDAPLHDQILDNPEADLRQRIRTAKTAIRELNWTESLAREMYNIPDDVEL